MALIGIGGVLLFGMIVYLLFEYKKYTKIKTVSKTTNTNMKYYSFKKYLKSKFKSRKKNPKTEVLSEKTFEMLQEIIDESANGK